MASTPPLSDAGGDSDTDSSSGEYPPCFLMIDDDGTGGTQRRVPLLNGTYLVGQAETEGCMIALPAAAGVSRRHAEIQVDGGAVFATDLASTNRTLIDLAGRGRFRLMLPSRSYQLSDGDRLRFGRATATFTGGRRAPPAAPGAAQAPAAWAPLPGAPGMAPGSAPRPPVFAPSGAAFATPRSALRGLPGSQFPLSIDIDDTQLYDGSPRRRSRSRGRTQAGQTQGSLAATQLLCSVAPQTDPDPDAPTQLIDKEPPAAAAAAAPRAASPAPRCAAAPAAASADPPPRAAAAAADPAESLGSDEAETQRTEMPLPRPPLPGNSGPGAPRSPQWRSRAGVPPAPRSPDAAAQRPPRLPGAPPAAAVGASLSLDLVYRTSPPRPLSAAAPPAAPAAAPSGAPQPPRLQGPRDPPRAAAPPAAPATAAELSPTLLVSSQEHVEDGPPLVRVGAGAQPAAAAAVVLPPSGDSDTEVDEAPLPPPRAARRRKAERSAEVVAAAAPAAAAAEQPRPAVPAAAPPKRPAAAGKSPKQAAAAAAAGAVSGRKRRREASPPPQAARRGRPPAAAPSSGSAPAAPAGSRSRGLLLVKCSLDAAQQQAVTAMGGTVLTQQAAGRCTHIVLGRDAATTKSVKLLCGMCTARHVVSFGWLAESIARGAWAAEGGYTPSGTAVEREYEFTFAEALAKPPPRNVFANCRLWLLPQAARAAARDVIRSGGGRTVDGSTAAKLPAGEQLVVVADGGSAELEEKRVAQTLAKCREPLCVSAEWVVTAALRQKLPTGPQYRVPLPAAAVPAGSRGAPLVCDSLSATG
eukprot:TRINITY_DN4473_c0_g1_i1.p1 TRINITY_DN4473_c0_g1~~TRINITY_DN4473_c0_g1_i1.p1  ORF type:complete len:845 (+),score=138.64 TRINITY_DN4473_c0_g1_i1:113-2536(+)